MAKKVAYLRKHVAAEVSKFWSEKLITCQEADVKPKTYVYISRICGPIQYCNVGFFVKRESVKLVEDILKPILSYDILEKTQ